MGQFKIYLAGAMKNLTFRQMNQWREDLKAALNNTFNHVMYPSISGLKVINPCDYYNYDIPRAQTELEVMNYDLAKVKESNLVIVNLHELNQSIGATIEIYEAWTRGIPVIGYDLQDEYTDIHPWLQCCMTRVESDETELMEYIKDFYFC